MNWTTDHFSFLEGYEMQEPLTNENQFFWQFSTSAGSSLQLNFHQVTSKNSSINIFAKYCTLVQSISTSTISRNDALLACDKLRSHCPFEFSLHSHHFHSLSCWGNFEHQKKMTSINKWRMDSWEGWCYGMIWLAYCILDENDSEEFQTFLELNFDAHLCAFSKETHFLYFSCNHQIVLS